MRSKLAQGRYYGSFQKYGTRYPKPWEVHEMYQECLEDVKVRFSEDIFVDLLKASNFQIPTMCITNIVNVKNGAFVCNHVWVDKPVLSELPKDFPENPAGVSFVFTADLGHYEKFENGFRTYDFNFENVNIEGILSGKRKVAYENALKNYESYILKIRNWIETKR